jgi:voltage-gated potassium channel
MSRAGASRVARRAARQRGELQARIAAWLDLPLAVLALVSLALLVAELALELPPDVAGRVAAAQTAIWAVFVLDFLSGLLLAPAKLAYLRRNWLAAVSVALPALRAVRLLRAARALRGLSLVRVLTSVNRGTRSLGLLARRGQLGYVLGLTAIVTASGAAAGYYFERDAPGRQIATPGQALWWAATLVTTINTGLDTTTAEGHVIGLLLRVFAVAVSGYLTAIIAAHLIGRRPPAEGSDAAAAELRALRAEVVRLRAVVDERLAPSPGGPVPAGRPRPEHPGTAHAAGSWRFRRPPAARSPSTGGPPGPARACGAGNGRP